MFDYILVVGKEMIITFICYKESKSIFLQIFFQQTSCLKMGLINFLNKQDYLKYTDTPWTVWSF